ncbi:hypothetical protein [Blastococcus brunescens]|uniref:Uncharacterized protein n=1 Tax=Blastococcus brunescens TaxID=1564165 RepID=A0ABZ1AX93_9ACTN|nr:hypothetical protein [Blastococcus sp. BMG 8361]WRL62131.1 hypothetical protein U6N30_18995 [Blastococcus sp. BMG 8361]
MLAGQGDESLGVLEQPLLPSRATARKKSSIPDGDTRVSMRTDSSPSRRSACGVPRGTSRKAPGRATVSASPIQTATLPERT